MTDAELNAIIDKYWDKYESPPVTQPDFLAALRAAVEQERARVIGIVREVTATRSDTLCYQIERKINEQQS